jgi:hypothetical protein
MVEGSRPRHSDPSIVMVNFSATSRAATSNSHGSNNASRPLTRGADRVGLKSVQSIGITRRKPPGVSTITTGIPRIVWRRHTDSLIPTRGSIG